MKNERIKSNGALLSARVAAGCPCDGCGAPSVWRGDDGIVVCPSFRKCVRYVRWFGKAWREVKAPFIEGGSKNEEV